MTTELKDTSPMSGGLSAPDCITDPEEKEISDDDDDDRNHKHRRREARSHSLEGDPSEQGSTHPYRKRNRPFGNGPHSEYNSNGGSSKFEKRRTVRGNFSRFSGEHSFGRGRGRDYQRFGNIDTPMPLSHQGPIPSGMFSGRGLSNVSNVPTASWNNFGLIPTIPNGTIDSINPLAMPILRSQLNPSFNMGIQRQRCPDFEERGFCLRGDMCPMEHGVNRIVVEDVQSLSQFNLPVSLPSAHLTGTSTTGSGFVPSMSVSSNTVINSSGAHGRPSKSTVLDDDTLNLDGAFSLVASNTCTADVYDPDQPLWNNDGHDTSTQLFGLQPPKFNDSETSLNAELSDHVAQSGASVWGRLNSSKSKMEMKGKYETRSKPSEYQERKSKEIREATQLTGKKNNLSKFVGPKTSGSTSKMLNDVGPNAKKSAQKANRTLFVNCIPLKDNKKENLLSHFRKFGEVIDIYVPANSERAFVQYSKKEEAERALKAPDAVMGSRFIKLWWANRDNIPDEGNSSGNNVSVPSAVAHKRKDTVEYAVSRVAMSNAPDNSLVNVGNESKPVVGSGTKGPPLQKKMESLEHLKEELRKKQEMLEQKRNEFRRQLDKLAKQATGAKNDASDTQVTKKQKIETCSDDALKGGKSEADAVVSGSSSSMQVEKLVNQASTLVESFSSPRSKPNSAPVPVPVLLDPHNLKHALRPPVMSAVSFQGNRFKLDNRPTEFNICPPIPPALANVTALKNHFKIYGDVSNVEIQELNEEDNPKYSARVSFTTRHAAERAFSNGKLWQDHNLQFKWVTPTSGGETSSTLRGVINSQVDSKPKLPYSDSQDIIAHKSSNEPSSDDISTSNNEGNPNPTVAAEEKLVFEGGSQNYIPLETEDPENQEDTVGGDMSPDEDLKMEASDDILTKEKEVA